MVERLWACGAFALAVIGSIGPWATLGIFSKAGTDGDGVISLVAASVGIIAALVAWQGSRVVIGILGVVVAAVGIIDIGDVSSSGAELFGQEIKPSVGWGLWLVTIGGVAAAVCAMARNFGIVRA
jgi:hypothetical protein